MLILHNCLRECLRENISTMCTLDVDEARQFVITVVRMNRPLTLYPEAYMFNKNTNKTKI